MWGYEPTFTKSAWEVDFDENEYGSHVEQLYPTAGHPLNGGRPSPWDAPRDPFHTEGSDAAWMPVQLDAGDRMDPAEDLGPGQMAEIDRVCTEHADLVDDALVDDVLVVGLKVLVTLFHCIDISSARQDAP